MDALPAVAPASHHDGYDLLCDAIDALPASQRDVINGLYWERLSQGMLARRLGVKQQAISRRHARAVATIRRTLNGGRP